MRKLVTALAVFGAVALGAAPAQAAPGPICKKIVIVVDGVPTYVCAS